MAEMRSLMAGGRLVPAAPTKVPAKPMPSESTVMMEALRVQLQATQRLLADLNVTNQAQAAMAQATTVTVQAQESMRQAQELVRSETARAVAEVAAALAERDRALEQSVLARSDAAQSMRALEEIKANPPTVLVPQRVEVPAPAPENVAIDIQKDTAGQIRRFVLSAAGHENVAIDVQRGVDGRVNNLEIRRVETAVV